MIQWVLAIWPLDPLPFLSPACTSRSTKFIYRWSLQKWDNQGARRVVRLPGTAEGHVPTSQAWQNVVHWRRGWKTTLVFLPWEFHERNEKNYHMTQQSHYWAHSHNWKHNWKRNMYPNIHCKTIYSSQDKEPRYSLIDEWIKKIWYIYAVEYYLAIKSNGIGSFVEMWMDPLCFLTKRLIFTSAFQHSLASVQHSFTWGWKGQVLLIILYFGDSIW